MLLALLLCACASSPPTHFFTLHEVAPAAALASGSGGQTPVKVDAIHIPPALDRNSMVRGVRGSELEISSQDRWAGDLGETIRQVLTQDLSGRLGAAMVIAPDAPAPPNARGIVVDIMTFQPGGAGEVVLDADWTLLEGTQSHPVLSRSEHLTCPAAPSAQAEAAAMSTLVGQLADRMAAAIGSAAPGAPH